MEGAELDTSLLAVTGLGAICYVVAMLTAFARVSIVLISRGASLSLEATQLIIFIKRIVNCVEPRPGALISCRAGRARSTCSARAAAAARLLGADSAESTSRGVWGSHYRMVHTRLGAGSSRSA